jgi:hypothetical protein
MIRIGGGYGGWLWQLVAAHPALSNAAMFVLAVALAVYAIYAYRKIRAVLNGRDGPGGRP